MKGCHKLISPPRGGCTQPISLDVLLQSLILLPTPIPCSQVDSLDVLLQSMYSVQPILPMSSFCSAWGLDRSKTFLFTSFQVASLAHLEAVRERHSVRSLWMTVATSSEQVCSKHHMHVLVQTHVQTPIFVTYSNMSVTPLIELPQSSCLQESTQALMESPPTSVHDSGAYAPDISPRVQTAQVPVAENPSNAAPLSGPVEHQSPTPY